jgi:hypothetical protein
VKDYNPLQPLISIHIPKCAGSSFNLILRKWFKRKLYLHYPNEKKNQKPKKHKIKTGIFNRRLKSGICIHGHFNYKRNNGPDHYYPEINQYITFIRDPFEIQLSTYFFVRNVPEGRYRDGKPHPIIEHNYTIKEYLEKYTKSHLCSFFPPNLNEKNFKEIINANYVYIGLADDLKTSVEKLAEKLDFPKIEVPTVNVSPRKEIIPEEAKEIFVDNNKLEYAIYNYILGTYKQ